MLWVLFLFKILFCGYFGTVTSKICCKDENKTKLQGEINLEQCTKKNIYKGQHIKNWG
jgi:hypothetical protein